MRARVRQDHAQQYADKDLDMRLQAEENKQKEKSLVEQKERAQRHLIGVYQASRATHVAAKRAIDEVAHLSQHVQLAQGAVERVAKVARVAMAAAPVKKRAKLERELVRPGMALSAVKHALSTSAKHAGSEVARAVEQTRESQKQVYKHCRVPCHMLPGPKV